jgi:hypothetical protein
VTAQPEGTRRALAGLLAALLLLVTLGEGGSAPDALFLWHAGLVALVGATLFLVPPERRRWPAGVVLAIGGFLIVFVAGWARAPYAYGALATAIELAASIGVGWLGWRSGPRGLDRVVSPLLFGAAVHGAIVIGQRLAAGSTRPASTFLNPNHLACWLVAALLLFAGAELGREGAVRWRRSALAAPALAGVVLTGSRGGLLALGAGGVVLLAFGWHALTRRRRRAALGMLALALILTALAAASRLGDHDPFRYHRIRIWHASVESWLDSPWWGSGPGGFEAAALRFRFEDGEGPLRYDKFHSTSHSDPLRVLAELGLPAALLVALALLAAARRLIEAHRSGRLPASGVGAVAAIAAVGMQGLVDNPSESAALYVLAAYLWGAALACGSPEGRREEDAAPRVALVWRTAAALLIVLAFLVADAAPYLAWREVAGLPRGRLDDAELARLDRAMRLNPLHAGYPARFSEHTALGELDLDTYANGREAAERAIRLHAAAPNWLALARLEATACRRRLRTIECRERTRGAYEQAERLSPYDVAIDVEAAIFLLDTGDAPRARVWAERALRLEPETVLPRLVLADALLEDGSDTAHDEAGRLIDEAEAKARSWRGWSERSALLRLDDEAVSRLRKRLPSGG